jgi:hypothetical protein
LLLVLMMMLLLLLMVLVRLMSVLVLVVLLVRCIPRRFQHHHARRVRCIDCGHRVGNRARH